MALSFRIDGEPVTWKRPVWLRRGVVYSPNTPFMQDIQVQLRGQFTGPILQGPLRVEVAFYFKRPNNHFAGFIRRADAATWYGRRVDLDNLNKLSEKKSELKRSRTVGVSASSAQSRKIARSLASTQMAVNNAMGSMNQANATLDAAKTELSGLSDALEEMLENFDFITGSNILIGPNTLLSAHYYLSDVTEIMKANMTHGQLVFPNELSDHPLDTMFGDPQPSVEKALVVTWIDKNLQLQKRAFKQLDVESQGCKLWDV